jgi:hypothetical protein
MPRHQLLGRGWKTELMQGAVNRYELAVSSEHEWRWYHCTWLGDRATAQTSLGSMSMGMRRGGDGAGAAQTTTTNKAELLTANG